MLAVSVPVVVAQGDRPDQQVRAAAPTGGDGRRPTTSPGTPTTTAATAEILGTTTGSVCETGSQGTVCRSIPIPVYGPPSTVPTVPPITAPVPLPPPPTATPEVACRNSRDERCGPFRWDPPPGPGQPANLTITHEPANPVAGQEVVFTTTFTDPDSASQPHYPMVGFGDGEAAYELGQCAFLGRFGPWTPPPGRPGRHTKVVRHTYAEAGTYTVAFTADGLGCSGEPYGSEVTATATVAVLPAPGQ